MAEVSVRVNGRVYPVGCEDGQERHVATLAEMFDRNVAQVAHDVGQLGETRLFLMGALLMADELAEARGRLAAASAELAQAEADKARAESRAVAALEQAARKIESLAAKAS
ncbi:MAG TPA: cell division protein ZapA [Caulobacteraceae bacterium]